MNAEFCRRIRLSIVKFVVNTGLVLLSFALSVTMLEVGVRLLTPYPNHLPRSNQVKDEQLGYRLVGGSFETNSVGFRAPERVRNADIVAIGDSHTFGGNVGAADAWPNALSRNTGLSFYNFGVPGYNIIQYRRLLGAAFALKPKIIVIANYAYNDFESFCSDYVSMKSASINAEEPRWLCAGRPEKKGMIAEPFGLRSLALVGAARDILRRVRNMSPRVPGVGLPDDAIFRVTDYGIEASFVLADRSAYYTRLSEQRPDREDTILYFDDLLRTFRLAAVKSNTRVIMATIPSKDLVYSRYLSGGGVQVPAQIDQLVKYETDWQNLARHAARKNLVEVCELEEPLVDALRAGTRIYKRYDNSHPGILGYAVYANAIAKCIDSESVHQIGELE